jgi:hypothetical protein
VAAVWIAGGDASRAVLDEAHSAIMEAVEGHVEDGFTIRAEYWSGALEAGAKKLVRHQLVRGNEYWFWLATATPGAEVRLEVYDGDGVPVSLERSASGPVRGVRVTPSQTGFYYVVVQILRNGGEQTPAVPVQSIDWALVYGYR